MTAQEKMKAWCKKHASDGYIYGATGWICTEARRQQQANQYPAQANTIMTTGAKWDGKQVWDCAQFTRFAAKEAGVTLPSGATSQWNKASWKSKGEIANIPKDTVCFVYRQDGTVMQHTGVYQGDGYVYDDRGTKSGVTHGTLASYPWTHYAIPNYDDGEEKEMEVLYQAKVKADSGSTVRMRATPSTAADVVEKVAIGETVDVYESADGWSHIKHDDNTGYMMDKFLSKIDGEDEDEDVDGITLSEADVKSILNKLEAIETLLTAKG